MINQFGSGNARCCQATSHNLNQCSPRSIMPNDITRPQWVNLHCTLLYQWPEVLVMQHIKEPLFWKASVYVCIVTDHLSVFFTVREVISTKTYWNGTCSSARSSPSLSSLWLLSLLLLSMSLLPLFFFLLLLLSIFIDTYMHQWLKIIQKQVQFSSVQQCTKAWPVLKEINNKGHKCIPWLFI